MKTVKLSEALQAQVLDMEENGPDYVIVDVHLLSGQVVKRQPVIKLENLHMFEKSNIQVEEISKLVKSA